MNNKASKKLIKNRIIQANEQCANCLFFSITTKKWAIQQYCTGYCCCPEFNNKIIKNVLTCEWFIENL